MEGAAPVCDRSFCVGEWSIGQAWLNPTKEDADAEFTRRALLPRRQPGPFNPAEQRAVIAAADLPTSDLVVDAGAPVQVWRYADLVVDTESGRVEKNRGGMTGLRASDEQIAEAMAWALKWNRR